MESFYDVLFEISNEDRHKILIELADMARNVTQLSKSLGMSLTETSRHLARLGEVELVKKNVDGFYHLTSYSKLILKLLPGFHFITNQKNYFLSHSLLQIPLEFTGRIGELSDSKYTQDQMVTISRIEAMMKEAEEYIWILHDQYLMSGYSIGAEALMRGVKIRSIDPKFSIPSLELRGEVSTEDKETINNAVNTGLCEMGTLERIDVFLYLSEKEVSIVAFPALSGKFDYLGFSSRDERAHKWCKDLFEYFWERTEPKLESDFAQIHKTE